MTETTNTAAIGGVVTGAFIGLLFGGVLGFAITYLSVGEKLAKKAEI